MNIKLNKKIKISLQNENFNKRNLIWALLELKETF